MEATIAARKLKLNKKVISRFDFSWGNVNAVITELCPDTYTQAECVSNPCRTNYLLSCAPCVPPPNPSKPCDTTKLCDTKG